MSPKVSVCMPTYNSAPFLPEAIESVLAQTYEDFELIVIDDCSRDDSVRIIEQYAARDTRIRVTVNERNTGMVPNWNQCLRRANGEYIKFVFGDDLFASRQALDKMVSRLDADDDIVLAATARDIIDDRSTVVQTVSHYRGNRKYTGSKIILDCLLEQRNKIGEPSAVLFRKRNAVRGFDERYRQIVDLEMWFHVLEQGAFAYIDEPLCSFRVHPNQQTKVNCEGGHHLDESALLLEGYSRRDYVEFSAFKRTYMYYVPAYGIWKLWSRHKKIPRKTALDRMQSKYHCSLFRLYAFWPLYKAYRWYVGVKDKWRLL